MTQDSLLGFLSGTGLPVVSRLVAVVRWMTLVLAGASLLYGAFALVWWPEAFWRGDLPWGGAMPALVTAPIYAFAHAKARQRRMQAAAMALFVALFAVSILATWPRGAFSTGWYMQPFLALLATCGLGVMAGLTMTLVAVLVLLGAALAQHGLRLQEGVLPELWVHATSLAALTLASALCGALLHKVLLAAVQSAETQRRRQLESSRALRHREKLLRHALRVETVGDLAGMVVHQLRNSFQVMMAHVSLAASAGESEREERLQLVDETLRQSVPLLDQLMQLAHPGEGQAAAADLNHLAAEFHKKAARVIPSSITLRFEPTDADLPVVVDGRGLEHALWNLVINARHAITGQGSITLRTGGDGARVWIGVEDSGCGIPEDVQKRIFDPYFTTKPVGQGTGLGLAAVARFMRGSNGSVDVRSVVAEGSQFVLRFPRRGRREQASA